MKYKAINKLINKIEESSDLKSEESLKKYFDTRKKNISVLGFDIYHYSQYKNQDQDIIPFLFDDLLRESSIFAATFDSFIFQKEKKEIYTKLISTGDGGFLTFENPLNALIFLLYFNIQLKYFNSFHRMEKIRKMLGPISIRYAITTDSIFGYDHNIFGPAIINNARIMSGDKLNRLIIDKKTHEWFEKNLFGLENLPNIDIPYLKNKNLYKKYNDLTKNCWYITHNINERNPKIINVDVLKIGESEIKKTKLDTYNVIVTYKAKAFKKYDIQDTEEFNNITLNLGNYNTTGL
ncbi:hypothetical protein LPTSP2_04710 [Leptospira ellinghausenii]|uniref:Uncharacterized protein n=1 Tax=Leptospira ellinghausenii TaxID=1917822 RepID=A0A2P2D997_9LEPT|nr:hypothetical protein [Leptospira ellinghausenii]GBF41199.1 hypothetical protein LPTSP2_04710 [Leptospira ellinghausenii]